MVPGMTEREFHALDLIRREWLDGELGRRAPVLPESRPSGKTWLATARALVSRVGTRLSALLPAGAARVARPSVDVGGTERGVAAAGGSWSGRVYIAD